ncbi:MAG: DUF2892 domain-containing protein [Thermoguttaceae bacterium]|jgi:hypothetical protein|nr:DUF2892 domain-containing protein [Thermoguttaceae bacterium]
MTIERGLRLVAGVVVLASVALAVFINPYWLLLTAFVGLNLLQSALTNWCPMVWVLARAGLAPCVAVRPNRTQAIDPS